MLSEEQKQKIIEMAKEFADKFSPEKFREFVKKHPELEFLGDALLLFQMITDPDYKVDPTTYLVIAGALAYLVVPLDLIPDFIPIGGWVDDAFIIGFVISQLKGEVERYKEFRKKRERGSDVIDVEVMNPKPLR
ncbi:MAG: DUF1232 domain-containing protein [Campylobacterales bacterium]|jgi:uncharacterized membrane protein YkvA (DUF1232 family)